MAEKEKLFDLTNDVAFQSLFGHARNERITKKFLERILGIEIEGITLDVNKRLISEYIDDKIGRIDVKARLNDGTKVFVEMQVARYKRMAERFLSYWSNTYIRDLKQGDSYRELRKTIGILISCENLECAKGIDKHHTEWKIREKNNPDKILTDDLEIHMIELKKFDEKQTGIAETDWIRFIKNGEVDMSDRDLDKELQEAREELRKIMADEETRELYEQREKDLRDKISFALAEREEGYEEGETIGIKKGIEQNTRKVVKSMHKDGIEVERIAKICKLDKAEVEKILDEEKT